jgi:hypothetical protein
MLEIKSTLVFDRGSVERQIGELVDDLAMLEYELDWMNQTTNIVLAGNKAKKGVLKSEVESKKALIEQYRAAIRQDEEQSERNRRANSDRWDELVENRKRPPPRELASTQYQSSRSGNQ